MTKLDYNRGEIIAGKYEVVDVLDDTPLGPNFRVKHQRSGAFVRLTLIKPKLAGRFNTETLVGIYQKVREVSHPSLVRVLELGEHEGLAYFTWEDFTGQTLRELINEYRVQGQRFELLEAAQITNQILDGLRALHDMGYIVRGLRPEYILINVRRTGPRAKNFVANVKITGSGFWDLVPGAQMAEDEFSRGEAQYLPPEMKSFEPVSTVRADVYSAGVIFYELLTGTAPLGTFQLPATVRPDLPKIVNDIVELALANSPEDRYQTAADFMGDIQRTISNSDVPDDQPKRLMSPVGWAILFIVAAAVGVIFYAMRPDAGREKRLAEAKDETLRAEVTEQFPMPPSREEIEALLKNQPPNMVYVPAGPFIAGRMNVDPDSLSSEPLAQVNEVKAFLIDRFEQPNQLNAPAKFDVDYATAAATCSEQGKRLCTAMEWEKACKGPLNSIYGYDAQTGPADTYDQDFCGDGLADRGYPSGSHEGCKSGYGVFDMSGNYREWTETTPGGKDGRRLVKGGLARSAIRGTRCAHAEDQSEGFSDDTISFRCCKDIE